MVKTIMHLKKCLDNFKLNSLCWLHVNVVIEQCQIKDIGSFVIPVGIVFAHHVFPVIVARSVQVDINVVSVLGDI